MSYLILAKLCCLPQFDENFACQTAQVESLTTSDSRSNEWSALLPDMTPHRLIQYPDNFQNGKLTSSFARVRVVEIRGNLNLLIGEDLEVNSYPPETTHLNSFQLNSTELLNSQGKSFDIHGSRSVGSNLTHALLLR